MKAIMIMFDSLNRHMISPYGCDWTKTPNFTRLAQRTATFDQSYVCSMPCMPARRDMHTGRPSFIHRSWSPLEPFDDSVPQMLKQAGVHTHLATDHYHYFEDNGFHYNTKFSTWELFRGQEGDPCIGEAAKPNIPANINAKGRDQDWTNRKYIDSEDKMPMTQSFNAGIEYIKRNQNNDNWFLQLETFDPHEPYCTMPEHQAEYAEHFENYDGEIFDWPGYKKVDETPEQVEHARYNYASLLTLCDKKLGQILDLMDEKNMWDDTMLIVCTDHGFSLGEHECWAKNWMPLYQEIAHTPFFVWDPRAGKSSQGQRRQALVQPCLDLGPTLLNYFNVPTTNTMTGKDLAQTIADDTPVRDAAIFGYHGCRVNITDGKYVYMRGNHKADVEIFNYGTLLPALNQSQRQIELMTKKWDFAKDFPLFKIPMGKSKIDGETAFNASCGDLLYDVAADPNELTPIEDQAVTDRLCKQMKALLVEADAPTETYERLAL